MSFFMFFVSCCIVTCKDKLWVRIVHTMGIETQSFVDRHVDAIMEMIVSGSSSQQVCELRCHFSLYKTCFLVTHCQKYLGIALVLSY